MSLRVANNIQAEEIKILKTEIAKIRKRGVPLSGRVLASQERLANNQNAENVLINPYDAERLKEEVAALKKELNDLKEDNKVLRAQQEKYKKRAEYAKAKFYEAKDKEARDPGHLADSHYRLKNTELKAELKKQSEEHGKLVEQLSQTKQKLL